MSLDASYPVSRGNFHNAISHTRTPEPGSKHSAWREVMVMAQQIIKRRKKEIVVGCRGEGNSHLALRTIDGLVDL